MTDKTKKALNNTLASVKMEGLEFTDEQIDMLIKLIKIVNMYCFFAKGRQKGLIM